MAKRLRYKRLSGSTQGLLRTEGESGRFEFKQTAEAAKQDVLVAAANAAALEHLTSVTILVGVGERVDETTGAVSGEVLGLQDIDRSVEKITNYGQDTWPVPVGLRIIQENLETRKPILRLDVWPTRPPHYTQGGRRVTRYGASTRAITDEELVEIYLQREAQSFQARFRETASELIAELVEIRELTDLYRRELEETRQRLVEVHEMTDQAAGAAEESFSFAEGLSIDLGRVEGLVEELASAPPSSEEAFHQLRVMRSQALFHLSLIRDEDFRAKVAEIIEPVMNKEPRVFDYRRNLREGAAWNEFMAVGPSRQEVDEEALLKAARAVVESRETPDRRTFREELNDLYFRWWQDRQG